jgi:hypothetical protein
MSLLERDSQGRTAWLGTLPVTNRYTYGLAGERFFRAIKDEGRIYGTVCPKCKRTYVPAVSFCERCLGGLSEWIDVGIQGEVHTYTLLYENVDGSPRQEPFLVAFIKMGDGGLVHCLGEIVPQDVVIGMKVQAVFNPKEVRTGSILDILYFKPV